MKKKTKLILGGVVSLFFITFRSSVSDAINRGEIFEECWLESERICVRYSYRKKSLKKVRKEWKKKEKEIKQKGKKNSKKYAFSDHIA